MPTTRKERAASVALSESIGARLTAGPEATAPTGDGLNFVAHPPQKIASAGFSLEHLGHFSLRNAPQRIQCLLSASLSRLQVPQRAERLLQSTKDPLLCHLVVDSMIGSSAK